MGFIHKVYAVLMDYQDRFTIKIDGIAASAASVIAMAGNKFLMAPTALMMIYNPMTIAYGNHRALGMLNEVKESISNAYKIKTDLSRIRLRPYSCIKTVDILPFNQLSSYKYKELGIPHSPKETKESSLRELHHAQHILEMCGINVTKKASGAIFDFLNVEVTRNITHDKIN